MRCDPSVTQEHSRGLLLAIADGRGVIESDVKRLVDGVLGDEVVQLALIVAEGGEGRDVAVLRLATALVARGMLTRAGGEG